MAIRWTMTYAAWAILFLTASVHGKSDLLRGQRWQEHSYGISLKPPVGWRQVSQTGDEALVRFYSPAGNLIRLDVKDSAVDLTVADLIPKAIHQLGGVYPSARITGQKKFDLAGRPVALIYFSIPDRKRGPWVLGQAYAQLTKRSFAMLQMEVGQAQFKSCQVLFEAILESIDIQDPQQLDQLRQSQVELGHSWLTSLATTRLQESMKSEQWLRMVDHDDNDIGYIRVRQKRKIEMGKPGVNVEIQSRIVVDQSAYDTISKFFASNDGESELWSVRTTERPRHANASKTRSGRTNTQSWAQTGVRSKDQITVSLERPSGIQKYQWKRPPKGYLSQVQIHLLEPLLHPPNINETLGFYAYYPNAQKVTFRTSRIDSAEDGSYVIYSRLSPDQDEQASYYDAKGKLLRRVLPGGSKILPTNKNRLRMKWQIR